MRAAVLAALFAFAALTTACAPKAADGWDDHDAPHYSASCTDDPSECAIARHEATIGPLSAQCAEVVRATEIHVVPAAAMDARCPFGADAHAVGCVVHYDAQGATAIVDDSEIGTSRETAMHELLHVALRCSRGDFDSGHSRWATAWRGLTLE